MLVTTAFAKALKQARKANNLTQEDFSDVSSRTYVSSLERGIKSPTIEKVDDLAGAMNLHPLTLLTLTYLLNDNKVNLDNLLEKIREELKQIS